MEFSKLSQDLAHKKKSIQDLVEFMKNRSDSNQSNYSILLGAGCSVTSGVLSGESLVDEWRKEAYQKYQSSPCQKEYSVDEARNFLSQEQGQWYSRTNEYSSLFEYKFDLPSQRRMFVESLVENAIPSIGYSYLVSLSNDHFIDTIYTTNFDDLINESFYQFCPVRPIVCAHDSSLKGMSLNTTRPKILKLHGDYLFNDIKNTARETESLEKNMREKFMHFSKDYGLIVVGYSGRDRSIMDLLNQMLESDEFLSNGVYWCLRKGDQISPELLKLLWKDKVYFLEIDGFDEMMAELCHSLNSDFIISNDVQNTRRDELFQSFVSDVYKLSETSEYISDDLKFIKKERDQVDISKLIRDLNKSDESDLSEEVLKELLIVEKSIQSGGDLLSIERILKEKIKSFEDKPAVYDSYTRRLIYILCQNSKNDEAISLSEQLIERNPNQLSYIKLKASLYNERNDAVDYLKTRQDLLRISHELNNLYANSLIFIASKNPKASISMIDESITHYRKSLSLHPSLDNPSWHDLYQALTMKRKSCEQNQIESVKKDIDELISNAKAINEYHYDYCVLYSEIAKESDDWSIVSDVLNHLMVVADSSNVSKKSRLMMLYQNIILRQLSSEFILDAKSEYQKLISSEHFIECEERDQINAHLIRARFELSYNQSIKDSQKYLSKAIEHRNYRSSIQTIVNLSVCSNYRLEDVLGLVKASRDEVADSHYYDMLSEVNNAMEQYGEAIENIDKSHHLGLNDRSYIISKSFFLLREKEYTKCVNFIESTNYKELEKSERDTVAINLLTAKKLRDGKADRGAIQAIISHKPEPDVYLAAHALLEDDIKVHRKIKEDIEQDFYNTLQKLSWPCLADKYKEKIRKVSEAINLQEAS